MNFSEACQYLDNLQQHKIKLGLAAMEAFLDKVDRPDRTLQFVHVAGTNGKGSVCINIVSVLASAGYRVGLFTSPHLSSVRERFRINDSYIDEETFARLVTRVRDVLGDGMITYFECTTAVALLWFAEQHADLVVLETGLGGRLDATNVVTPLVTVITNVSMDHETWLGNDLMSISREKAGIIKRDIPLVTGAVEGAPLSVIRARCSDLNASLYRIGVDFSPLPETNTTWKWVGEGVWHAFEYGSLHCGMKGDYQRDNASLAIAVLVLLQQYGYVIEREHIKRGIASVHWPGRLEYLSLENGLSGKKHMRYLLDGAHNPAGVESLLNTLRREYHYDRLLLIWGAMEDKDISLTLPKVAEIASEIVLTMVDNERAATPEKLLEYIEKEQHEHCHLERDVLQALYCVEAMAEMNDLIVVAGSLYLLGEVRFLLVGDLVDG